MSRWAQKLFSLLCALCTWIGPRYTVRAQYTLTEGVICVCSIKLIKGTHLGLVSSHSLSRLIVMSAFLCMLTAPGLVLCALESDFPKGSLRYSLEGSYRGWSSGDWVPSRCLALRPSSSHTYFFSGSRKWPVGLKCSVHAQQVGATHLSASAGREVW